MLSNPLTSYNIYRRTSQNLTEREGEKEVGIAEGREGGERGKKDKTNSFHHEWAEDGQLSLQIIQTSKWTPLSAGESPWNFLSGLLYRRHWTWMSGWGGRGATRNIVLAHVLWRSIVARTKQHHHLVLWLTEISSQWENSSHSLCVINYMLITIGFLLSALRFIQCCH